VSLSAGDIVNFIYLVYSAIREVLQNLIELTLIRGSPEAAAKFSDAIMFLTTVTAVYAIMSFTTSLKNMMKLFVRLGWLLLVLSIVITILF
jgi:hypothetical protein